MFDEQELLAAHAHGDRLNPESWAKYVSCQPRAHILQLMQWGEVKERFGWESNALVFSAPQGYATGAIVLRKKLPVP